MPRVRNEPFVVSAFARPLRLVGSSSHQFKQPIVSHWNRFRRLFTLGRVITPNGDQQQQQR